MEHNEHNPFEQAWPDIERRLQRLLGRKRVERWLRDDVVQETGLRLLRGWDDIDPRLGPWPLAVTIANNVLFDQTTRRVKHELLPGDLPERPEPHDVERAGIARAQLGEVHRALEQLTHNYRSILLREIGHRTSLHGSPRAINMLRMRARQKLAALVDKSASFGLGIPAAAKSSVTRLMTSLRRHPGAADAAAATTAILFAATASVLVPSSEAAVRSDAARTAEGSVSVNVPLSHRIAIRQDLSSADTMLDGPTQDVAEEAAAKAKEAADAADRLAHATVGQGGPAEAHATIGFDNEGNGSDTKRPRCQIETEPHGAEFSCRTKLVGHKAAVSAGARLNERPRS